MSHDIDSRSDEYRVHMPEPFLDKISERADKSMDQAANQNVSLFKEQFSFLPHIIQSWIVDIG